MLAFKLAAVLLGTVVSLVVAEAGLRIIEKGKLGDRSSDQNLVKDERLGLRLPPNTLGHDANGFRNNTAPAQSDIVVLGDSQTWGVNVERADAWPQQLGRLSTKPVYNMGFGGYGPAQYWALTENALKLSPKVIVVGLYLGNDIYDAYTITYTRSFYAPLRLANAPADLLQSDVVERAQALWDEEKGFHNGFGRKNPAQWSVWLREHTALGRLLNRSGWWPGSTDIDFEIDKKWAETYPEHGSFFNEGPNRTVFTTAYRLVGLDLDDPHIAEGLRLTGEYLVRIDALGRAHNCKVLVMMIPTKESVYAGAFKDKLQMSATFTKLIEMETRTRTELESTCQKNKLWCADALPAMTAATKRGEQLYFSSTESHPNAHGYSVLAAAVNDELNRTR